VRSSFGVCGFVAIVFIAGCRNNISGSYLAGDNSGVCWLELVRTPDARLTGQVACSSIKLDGSIYRHNSFVVGAVDGENVSLSGDGLFGTKSFVLSGVHQANTITLSSGQTVFTFKSATLNDLQSKQAELESRSQSILKANAEAKAQRQIFEAQKNFVAMTDELIARMQRFESRSDEHLQKLPLAEKAYESLTSQVRAYLGKERQLAGNRNAGVARSQIVVAETQVPIRTDQLHIQQASLQTAFDSTVKPIAESAESTERACQALPSNREKLTPDEITNVTSACARFQNALPMFRQKSRSMSDGLAHIEQVYQWEHSTQQQLIQQSEGMD